MDKATAIENAFVVAGRRDVGDESYIIIAIDPENPYRSFTKLPNVVEYRGRVYGKTGYNSDTNMAYYSTDAPIARAVRKGN